MYTSTLQSCNTRHYQSHCNRSCTHTTLRSFHHTPYALNLRRTPNILSTLYPLLRYKLLIAIVQLDTSYTSCKHGSQSRYNHSVAIDLPNTSYTPNIHDWQSSSKLLIAIVQPDTMWNTFHTYDLQLQCTVKLHIHPLHKHTASGNLNKRGQRLMNKLLTCKYRCHTPLSNTLRSSPLSDSMNLKDTPIATLNPLDNNFQMSRLSVWFHLDNSNQLDTSSWYSPLQDLTIYTRSPV